MTKEVGGLDTGGPAATPSQTKRVLMVWGFVIAYLAVAYLAVSGTGGGMQQQIPSSFSPTFAISVTAGELILFVPVMLFLVYLVRHYEGGTIRSTLSSLGLNRVGIGRSLLWSIVFAALLVLALLLWEGVIAGLFGSGFATAQTLATPIPKWYAIVIMIPNLLNAVMEESVGRGYMLDRLMPSHPAGLRASLLAILGVSILGMLYHIPTYLLGYHFSLPSAIFNFGVVFFGFMFVGLGYVRSHTRNISGPVLVHFLLDAGPYLLVIL
jgi:membrane protease YdiL (CAAX protease family)